MGGGQTIIVFCGGLSVVGGTTGSPGSNTRGKPRLRMPLHEGASGKTTWEPITFVGSTMIITQAIEERLSGPRCVAVHVEWLVADGCGGPLSLSSPD